MTKPEAEAILKTPKFGDPKCIEARKRLVLSDDLLEFLYLIGYDDVDDWDLEKIHTTAEAHG